MIEQENITLLHGAVFAGAVVVQLDIQLEQFFGGAKRADAEIVNLGIDFGMQWICGH